MRAGSVHCLALGHSLQRDRLWFVYRSVLRTWHRAQILASVQLSFVELLDES